MRGHFYMLRWRKRRDGFEWREYVRTTILVRRKRRRDRIEEAGRAAVDGLAQAGKIGVAAGRSGAVAAQRGLGQAGRRAGGFSRSSARWAQESAGKARAAIVPMGKAAAHAISRASVEAGGRVGRVARKGSAAVGQAARQGGARVGPILSQTAAKMGPAMRTIATPQIAMPLAIAGGAAALGAAVRIPAHGFDTTAMIATLIAAALLLLAWLPFANAWKPYWPSWLPVPQWSLSAVIARLPGQPRTRAISVMAVCLLGAIGIASMMGFSMRSPVQVADIIPTFWGPNEVVAGYAVSLTGDSMRIDGKTVRMADIEAPELTQTCARPNASSWNCGQSALGALRRLTGRNTITCDVQKIDASGHRIGTCRAGDVDLAAEMVRNGHVFASGGFFPTYGSEQSEAQSAKAGLWSGTSRSPQDYRDERWKTASRDAPQGCPIKGRVVANGKVYILPWSRNYEKYRVRDGRGDKWFCSEDEARSAGWVPDS